MDTALASNKFCPAALKRLNYCRLYLNVVLLSDITSPDGTHINKAAYDGNLTQLLSETSGHSVNQPKPNAKAWKEWRKLIHLLVHRDSRHTLRTPLDAWIVPLAAYSRRWKFLYSPSLDLLFTRTAVGYLSHKRLQYDFDHDPTDFRQDLPQDAVPIQARSSQYTWILPHRATA